jgi:hypothetical protein
MTVRWGPAPCATRRHEAGSVFSCPVNVDEGTNGGLALAPRPTRRLQLWLHPPGLFAQVKAKFLELAGQGAIRARAGDAASDQGDMPGGLALTEQFQFVSPTNRLPLVRCFSLRSSTIVKPPTYAGYVSADSNCCWSKPPR